MPGDPGRALVPHLDLERSQEPGLGLGKRCAQELLGLLERHRCRVPGLRAKVKGRRTCASTHFVPSLMAVLSATTDERLRSHSTD